MYIAYRQPVLTLLSICAIALPIGAAADECRQENAAEIGHAIGVLFHEQVLRGVEEFIDVTAVIQGISGPADSSEPMTSEVDKNGSTRVARADSAGRWPVETIEASERIVREWRRPKRSAAERFAKVFRRSSRDESMGGVLVREVRDLDDTFRTCLNDIPAARTPDVVMVCYARLAVDEAEVCRLEGGEQNLSAKAVDQLEKGVFGVEDVIAGWREIFERIGSKLSSGSRVGSDQNDITVIEVLIPPELAYAEKGLADKVEPGETLRFVLSVARSDSWSLPAGGASGASVP